MHVKNCKFYVSHCLNLGAAEKRVAENTARQGRRLGSKRPLHRQQQVGEPTPDVVYPPKPALFSNMFFHHRFSLWMPYHMLAFLFLCSQTGYERRQLSTKLHCVSYQVDDYFMGTEYLACGKCHRKVPAWSLEILDKMIHATGWTF